VHDKAVLKMTLFNCEMLATWCQKLGVGFWDNY